jgi:uncharacterized membrane protein YdbT with pleckstrin-like domain
MSYVDRHLLPDERVLFRTRLHWKTYVVPLLVALLILVPLSVWAFTSERPWLGAIPLGVAVLVVLPSFLRRASSEFAVTTRRVLLKYGVFTTHSTELLLAKVEGITVTQSLFGRMFNYGEIVVIGSGGTHEAFDNIQAPLLFRQAVQSAAGTLPTPGA